MKLLSLSLILMSLPSLAQECSAMIEWGRLVDARGGDDLMSKTKVVAIHKSQTWRVGLTRHRLAATSLYVLPDLMWSWSSPGSRPFDQPMVVRYDLRKRIKTMLIADDGLRPRHTETVSTDEMVFEEIPVLLLNANLVRLRPIKCVKVGEIVIVEATLGQKLYRFHAQRTEIKMVEEFRFNSPFPVIHETGEYRIFSGLKLPTRYIRRYRELSPLNLVVSYEINPPYDPTIMKRDLVIAEGPNAWREKP